MTQWLKHTGFLTNTQKKIVVVMMQLPEKPDHALITDSEALPPKIQQNLMEVLESREAQNTNDLYEVLQRRMMIDTNEPMLTHLFRTNYLQSVPVSQITMVPAPGVNIPLVDLINKLNETRGLPPLETQVAVNPNVIHQNLSLVQTESNAEVAKGLLAQAELLIAEAEFKKSQAYKLSPELKQDVVSKPVAKIAPAKVTAKKSTAKKSVKA